jgi:hypothetical protein
MLAVKFVPTNDIVILDEFRLQDQTDAEAMAVAAEVLGVGSWE